MSDRRDDMPAPGTDRVRNVLHGAAPVTASHAYRARLKNDFVSGQIDSDSPRFGRSRFDLSLRTGWIAVPLAALLAVGFLLLNRGPSWELAGLAGTGSVVVDGERVSAADGERLEALLRPGAVITTDDDLRLDLLLADRLLLEIIPGSEVTVPTTPGRWLGRTIRGQVERGELLFVTGEGFAGHKFLVVTDEALVEVTGTSVSVFRNDEVTCVCVHEGTARIGRDEDDLEPVPAGRRKVLPREGDPFLDDIAPPHQDHIREFTEREAHKLTKN